MTLLRKIKHCKLAKLWLKVKQFGFSKMCETWWDSHEDRHYHFDANPHPDLDRLQHGNSDPDRHQNDADPLAKSHSDCKSALAAALEGGLTLYSIPSSMFGENTKIVGQISGCDI